MRFHILAPAHTISTPEYSTCAFTQKVVKLCDMLMMRGHEVIHYGNAESNVNCTENVPILTQADLDASYPGWDWKKKGWPKHEASDLVYKKYNAAVPEAVKAHRGPKDILCCTFGGWHKPIFEKLGDMLICETGIGYPDGGYAPFRIFESYAIMSAYQGEIAIKFSGNNKWYDRVIPNSFNLDEFEFSAEKKDNFLFVGRVNDGKGIHVAKQIAETLQTNLIVAGAGENLKDTKYVKHVGVVSPKERATLMKDAKAVICASTFLEPFCGVQVESMLCGTPVISSDWGAFAEYNPHGVTGYRCGTFEQFIWAAKNIGNISPKICRTWGEKFSLENVSFMYDEYFGALGNILNGVGWYQVNDTRQNLDHTSFRP